MFLEMILQSPYVHIGILIDLPFIWINDKQEVV